jgi:hypothetical protein
LCTGPDVPVAGAAGKREIFADRFANDLGASVEQAGDDRRIEFRNKSFEHRSAVGQRNAGECVRIFHRYFLTRKLASAGALDARFRDPGAVFIFVTLGPVIGAARILHHRHVVGQRGQEAVTIAEGLDEVDERLGIVIGQIHAETVA